MDENYHLKVCDFGTANLLDPEALKVDVTKIDALRDRTRSRKDAGSFVGTEEYVSPEVIQDKESSHPADFWALGIMIYQFFTGKTPFKGATEYLTFQNILNLQLTFPKSVPDDAADLISKLLVVEPSQRLGCGKPGSANDL